MAFEPASPDPTSFEDSILEAAAEEDDGEPIEIVDDLGFDDVFEEAPVTVQTELAAAPEPVPDAPLPELPTDDPFLTLAAVVKDVAQTFGADPSEPRSWTSSSALANRRTLRPKRSRGAASFAARARTTKPAALRRSTNGQLRSWRGSSGARRKRRGSAASSDAVVWQPSA